MTRRAQPFKTTPPHYQSMSRHLLKSIIDDTPVVAIIRRPKVDPGDCAIHFFENGIRLVEITMDTKGAIEVIESLRSHVPPSALLGAGTVTDIVRAEAALKGGARFFF